MHEDKTGEKNQEVKGQEEAKLSALASGERLQR